MIEQEARRQNTTPLTLLSSIVGRYLASLESRVEQIEERQAIQDEPLTAITPKQRKRLWTLAEGAGFSEAGVRALLKQFGYTRTQEIPMDKYEGICAKLTKENAPTYNRAI